MELAASLNPRTVNDELRGAWKNLKENQKESVELRSRWLESIARVKAAAEGSDDPAKTLKILIRSLHKKRMHQKLTRITKGAHQSLDYIEVPTSNWYYAPSSNELYHYDKGVWEAHPAKGSSTKRFHQHHSLKVVPDDSIEVTVTNSGRKGFRISGGGAKPITWRRITERGEIENFLLRRNKRHLQQVAMEESPPSLAYFQDLLSEYGTSDLSTRLLEGEITTELDAFPSVVRKWILQFRRTEEEKRECKPIDGYVSTEDFQEAFRAAKEKTSSSPSGINYTL